MNEFLRTHGKWVMAILGVVLMVMWVMPQSQAEKQRTWTMGWIDGKKVVQVQLQETENEIKLLRNFANQASLLYNRRKPDALLLLDWFLGDEAGQRSWLGRSNAPLQYLLLVHEAEKIGVTPDDRPDGVVQQLLQAARLSDQTSLETFCMSRDISSRYLRYVLGRYSMVVRAREMAATAVQISQPALEHAVMDEHATVQAAYVTLKTGKIPPDVKTPLSDELKKQFELYKDQLPNQPEPPLINGHRYPFGYKYPDRVKIEYLQVPYAAVRETVAPRTAKDKADVAQAAFDYYAAHQEEFLAPAATAPATAPTTGSATAPATSTAPAERKVKPFTEVRQQLIEAQIDRRAETRLQEIADRARTLAAAPWKPESAQSDFRAPLPRESWVPLAAIAAQLEKQYTVKVTPRSPEGWLTAPDLTKLSGLGEARLFVPNGEPLEVAELALHVRELDKNQSGKYLRLALQQGVTGPILTDSSRNAYVYRVTDSQATHTPRDYDEVRDQLVYDLRREAFFNQQKQEGKKLARAAEEEGLKATARKSKLDMAITEPFYRRFFIGAADRTNQGGGLLTPPVDEKIGTLPEFTDKAFEMAERAGPIQNGSDPPAARTAAEKSSTSQPAAKASTNPAASIDIEPRLTVYVLQVQTYKPVNTDDFRKFSAQALSQRRAIEELWFYKEWSSLKNVVKRVNFTPNKEHLSLDKDEQTAE